MNFLKLEPLALGLILAFPAVYAAPDPGVVIAALNCPQGNTDPNCLNHVREGGRKESPAKEQQAQQQLQQQAQQKAQQQAQQQQAQKQLQQQAQQQAQQKQLQQQAQQQAQQKAQQQAQPPMAGQVHAVPQPLTATPGQPPGGGRQPSGLGRPPASGQVQQQGQHQEKQRPAQQQVQQQAQQQAQQPAVQQGQRQGRQAPPPPVQQPLLPQDQQQAQSGRSHERPRAAQQQMQQQAQQQAQQLAVQQGQRQGQAPVATQAQPPGGTTHQPGVRRLTPGQSVPVDGATSVVSQDNRSNYQIRHRNTDGSQMVISQKLLPDGIRRTSGYRQTENSQKGTSTRIYSDGHRVIQGRDFERRSVGSGLEFVTRHNGLREAVLPNGKPVFQDRFISLRDRQGRQSQVIERTRYARWANGRPEYEARPLVRQYNLGHIHGAPVAEYRPSHFAPEVYRSYRSRYAVPVIIAGAAAAAAWVAFGSPATNYDDPVALMGDMQISSGFEEGYAYATPSSAVAVYDTPEAAALRSQMATVQQQVNTSVQGNASLKEQLGGVDVQAASSQVQQAVGSAVPVQISEEVRQQVRKQVRLSVAMQQNSRPLVLSGLLASGYARIYLFQTAQPLNVLDVAAGGECFLNTGDLIGFSKLPAGDSATAEMKVIAGGSSSCPPDEVVQVRLTDLQEMLNGFSERVEDNMKRVSACAATGRC